MSTAANKSAERLRWQKSAEREWDVCLVVVEEQEEQQQGCEIVPISGAEQGQSKKTNPQNMAFESLNVRLTRANSSISWGFDLQQRGNDLVVSKLESGSMAEKAGICTGDTVQDILNQKINNLQQALGRIRDANEITMTLRRPIKNSPSLPWAFQTNANGQLAVDQYDAQGRVVQRSDPQTKGFQESFVAQSQAPDFEQRRIVKGSDELRSTNGPSSEIQQPQLNLPYNMTTHRAESNSNWNHDDGQKILQYESKRTYTRTESFSQPPPGTTPEQWSTQSQGQVKQQVGGQKVAGQLPAQQQVTGQAPTQHQITGQAPPQNRQQITATQQHRQTLATGPHTQGTVSGQVPLQQNGQVKGSQPIQQASQKDKSVALPGGVDYTQQNGHTTTTNYSRTTTTQQQQEKKQPLLAPSGFAAVYETKQQPPASNQPQPQHTYKINQYEQTDTINFAAPQQQSATQIQKSGDQTGAQSQQSTTQNQQSTTQKQQFTSQNQQAQPAQSKEPQSLAQFLQKQGAPQVPQKPSQQRISVYQQNQNNLQQGVNQTGSYQVQPGGQTYGQQTVKPGGQTYTQQIQTTTYQQNTQSGGQAYGQQIQSGAQGQVHRQQIQSETQQTQPGSQIYTQQNVVQKPQNVQNQQVQQNPAQTYPQQNYQQVQQSPAQTYPQQNYQQVQKAAPQSYQQNTTQQGFAQQAQPQQQNFQQTGQKNSYLSGQIQNYEQTAPQNYQKQQIQQISGQHYQQNVGYNQSQNYQQPPSQNYQQHQQTQQSPAQPFYQYNQNDLSASGYNSLPRQSRNAQFQQNQYAAEAPEWQSQISYQLRREPARRSRSQPRCCSRRSDLPGPIIYYHPPHSRTYRELSPSARVHHLQYNTPLDLYSDEAAAEAYHQHTGQELHFHYTDQPMPTTADPFQSETRRLIEQEELGIRPANAPPIQSASLKRIARAVGVPLD